MVNTTILPAKSPVSIKLKIAVRGGELVVRAGIVNVNGVFAVLKLGSTRRGTEGGMGSNGRP